MISPKCVSCPVFPKSLFRHCNPAELDVCFESRKYLELAKGQTLFNEGQEPLAIYCTLAGNAKITKKDTHGEHHIIRFTKPGEIIGIHALIGRHAYYRSAIAVTDMAMCYVPKEHFYVFVEKNPAFFFEVMQFLCAEVEEAETKMESLKHKTARQRLATGLLRLRQGHGLTKDRSLNLAVSMDDMANFLNTNRSSLYRLLNEFKAEKVIGVNDERIQILDETKLRRMAR